MTGGVLERFRHPRPDPEENEPVAITLIEEQILLRLGRGMTNREIGAELYLAEKTVRNNLSRLTAKIGSHGRTQAAFWAVQAVPGVDYVTPEMHSLRGSRRAARILGA